MKRQEIEKIVDTCFDRELAQIQQKVSMELYPAAFANEYSWMRVKTVFELNNQAIREAVKTSLAEILNQENL